MLSPHKAILEKEGEKKTKEKGPLCKNDSFRLTTNEGNERCDMDS